jgi:hypothetical protein
MGENMLRHRLHAPKRTVVRSLVVLTALLASGLVAAQAAQADPLTCIPTATLTPADQTVEVTDTATVDLSATDGCGNPLANTAIPVGVINGPNAGLLQNVVTDSAGNGSFSYSSTVTGDDHVVASVPIPLGVVFSNESIVHWVPQVVMTGHSYGLAANGLVKLGPTPQVGPIQTAFTTSTSKCTLAPRVGLLLSAQAVCADVATVKTTVDSSSAGASVANVGLALRLLPAISLRSVSAGSGTNCFGSNGSTEIGFLKIGTKVVISNLVHPAPNTTLNVLGIKLILNQQIPVPGGLTVNAVHLIIPNVEDLVIASATSDIHNCH